MKGQNSSELGVMIGSGAEANVYLSKNGGVISKVYVRGKKTTRVKNAEQEFEKLTKLYKRLESLEGISCPKPVSVDISDNPVVAMENCKGQSLHHFIYKGDNSSIMYSLAGKLSQALLAYIDEFDEPYWDFCCQNILYEEASDELTLLDFNPPNSLPPSIFLHENTAISLGNFVGWALYDSVRPNAIFNKYNNVILAFSAMLMENVIKKSGCELNDVLHVMNLTYIRLGHKGSVFRRVWYGSAGRLNFKVKVGILLKNLDGVESLYGK